MANTVTDTTRRAIVDYIVANEIDWAGRLAEDEFLSRLYDLTAMPSTDRRFQNAAGDIHQHRVNWCDGDDDWVFYDLRFNLLHCDDDEFLKFLCETVHPTVRPDSDKAYELAAACNRELAADGWQLVEVRQISGRPVFAPQKGSERVTVFEEPTGWRKVDRQAQEARLRLDTAATEEQYQAVGLLCRETLISAAQEVHDPTQHPSVDAVSPSPTDAKRMLEAIFEAELRGSTNEEARSHAKAALRLALALQHRRTADFRMAALCAEATSSVLNLLAVLGGRRGRVGPVSRITEMEGLEPFEVAALIAVAEESPDPDSGGCTAGHVEMAMTKAGFNKLAVTLGIRRLLEKEMLQSGTEQSDFGNFYTVYSVTSKGLAWLFGNHDKLQLRRGESTTTTDDFDDDIPF